MLRMELDWLFLASTLGQWSNPWLGKLKSGNQHDKPYKQDFMFFLVICLRILQSWKSLVLSAGTIMTHTHGVTEQVGDKSPDTPMCCNHSRAEGLAEEAALSWHQIQWWICPTAGPGSKGDTCSAGFHNNDDDAPISGSSFHQEWRSDRLCEGLGLLILAHVQLSEWWVSKQICLNILGLATEIEFLCKDGFSLL